MTKIHYVTTTVFSVGKILNPHLVTIFIEITDHSLTCSLV